MTIKHFEYQGWIAYAGTCRKGWICVGRRGATDVTTYSQESKEDAIKKFKDAVSE